LTTSGAWQNANERTHRETSPSAMTENKEHDKLFADLDALNEQHTEVWRVEGAGPSSGPTLSL